MTTVGVVHLARAANGPDPFRQFLRSYEQNPAGHAHELYIIYKGFDSEDALRPYEELLTRHSHKTYRASDRGYDLHAYYAAARHFNHEYLLYFNSYSVIQDGDWLAKYMAAIQMDRTGIVGATGSWESSFSHFLYRYFPDGGRPLIKRPLDFGRKLRKRIDFPPFPNPHIRTNAFLMRRQQLLADLKPFRAVRSKADAYRFESGRNGLTARLGRQGLAARVVGRDGVAYAPDEWAGSITYRQLRQENTLVGDNQTAIYEAMDFSERHRVSKDCWGDQAQVAP